MQIQNALDHCDFQSCIIPTICLHDDVMIWKRFPSEKSAARFSSQKACNAKWYVLFFSNKLPNSRRCSCAIVNSCCIRIIITYVITHVIQNAWWSHQMETFPTLLAICAGNSPVTVELPAQRLVTRMFDFFFDLLLNKQWSKQSWGWWFEMPHHLLWRHCNGIHINCMFKFKYWKPQPATGFISHAMWISCERYTQESNTSDSINQMNSFWSLHRWKYVFWNLF